VSTLDDDEIGTTHIRGVTAAADDSDADDADGSDGGPLDGDGGPADSGS
jgi:hypothetical protein